MSNQPATKKLACQNVLVTMLNEALSQGIIGLTDGENYQLSAPDQTKGYGADAHFSFQFAGHEFEGHILDVGAGELRLAVFLRNSKATRETALLNCIPHKKLPNELDAVFVGYFFRKDPPGGNPGGYPTRSVALLELSSLSHCRNSVPWRQFACPVVEPNHDFVVKSGT